MKKDLHFGFSTLLSRLSLRSRTLHILCLSLALFATIGQAWAGPSFKQGNIFFDATGITMKSNTQFCVGKDSYTSTYSLSKVDHTNYYKGWCSNGNWWDGCTYFAVISNSSSWGSGSWGYSNCSSNASYYTGKYTGNYSIDNTNIYELTPSGTANGSSFTINYCDAIGKLNTTQTLTVQLSTDGGSSYSDASKCLASVTSGTYYFNSDWNANSQGAVSLSSGSSTITGSATAAKTSTVSLSCGAETTGYTFVGWYYSDGTLISSSKTASYVPKENKIVYARFKENRYTVTFANDGHGSTSPTGNQTVGQITGISIGATPNTNYEFNTWTSSNGGSFQSVATTASNKFYPTANTTLTASFNSTATYSLTVLAGSNISSVTGSTDPVTLGSKYDITATPATGYSFAGWTKSSGAGTATFDDASAASTKVQVTVGSVTITASATENLSTVPVGVTSGQSSWGSLKFGSTARVWGYDASVGVATTQAITAVPSTGYRFVTWTLSGGAVLASGSLTDATITIRGNGNGTAGTATATFAEDLSTTWYISGTATQFGGWNTSGVNMTKNTGESTVEKYYADVVVTTLPGDNEWAFKVYNSNGDKYWAADGHWVNREYTNHDLTTGGGEANMQFKPDITGTYTFMVDNTNPAAPKLTLTCPSDTKYTVTLSANGEGTVSAASVLAGTVTTPEITATPNTGYRFTGWTGTTGISFGHSENATTHVSATQEGTATAGFAPDWYVKGDWNSWEQDDPIENYSTNTGYVDVTLAAGTTYDFKMFQPSQSGANQWWYNAGTMKRNNCSAWTFTQGDGSNCSITADVAGTYRFSWDASQHKLTVIYPAKQGYNITYPASPSHYTLGDGNPAQGEELSSVTFAASADEFYYLTVTATDASDNNVAVTDNHDGTYTFTMPSSAVTINISAQVGKTIYFKKEGISSSWSGDVWVYFYKGDYWDSGNKGSGSKTTDGGNCISGPKKMTRLGNTDIFYYSYANDGYIAQMSHYVAFTDHEQSEYDNFSECQVVYRGDFDERTPMFVVKDEYSHHNNCAYYNHGYWMTYNETTPGYTLRLYNQQNDAEPTQTITLSGNAGSTTFSGVSSTLSSSHTYYYELVRTDGEHFFKNNGTMTIANHEGWAFDEGNEVSRCGLTTTAGGVYTFILVCDNGRLMMSVDYPLSIGDLRVVHNNGTADKPSNYFKQTSETTSDTVSFFIDAAHPGTLRIQTCTAVDPITWADASPAVSASLAGYETGVYVFSVEHSTSSCSFTNISEKVLYTGNYYIRTDCAPGGWKSYLAESNRMPHSDMLRANTSGYDYYFVKWVSNGTNVRYVVANDYSLSISDTLKSDVILGGSSEVLPSNANVRFMWNSSTNALERAYINGSTYASDRFLVMADASEEKIFDKDGNSLTGVHQVSGLNAHEVTFVDKNNWVYQVDIQANPTARVNLTAKYNGADRTLLSNEEVLGGIYDAGKKYTIRTIYNFKTNHLVTALLPNGNYSTAEAISADVMIVREGQEDASQITFSNEGKFTEVKTVFGTMTFNKWTLNNKSKEAGHEALSPALSTYARDLYWISFPFDVNLEEVFGFGEYGEHWIIEYYDGAGRAAEGFWADSDPNWKFVFDRRNYTLHANMGYVLALDLSQLGESSSVWNNSVEEISLYFPSAAPVNSITDELPTAVTLPAHTCTIERDHRYIWDSNWNLIGVPSYANIPTALIDPDISKDKATLGAEADSLAFYYAWHPETNALKVDEASTSTFKAMYSYMVQYAGTINWKTKQVTSAAAAPRRNVGDQPTRTLCLNLMEDGEEVDRTFIQTNDEYTNQFDINRDLAKADNADLSTIYTIMDEVNLAANCLPLSDETILIPVGVKANSDATFTFTMPEGTEGLNVSLYDAELETSVDLTLDNYSTTLTKGTCNNRFFLRVGKHNAPTAIVPVSSENGDNGNGAVKLIKDNLLFIYYNGVLYDARGMKVK